MSKNNIKFEIENCLNSNSDNYKCVLVDSGISKSLNDLEDFISSHSFLSDDIKEYLLKAVDLLYLQCGYLSDYDVLDIYELTLYDTSDKRCENGRK